MTYDLYAKDGTPIATKVTEELCRRIVAFLTSRKQTVEIRRSVNA